MTTVPTPTGISFLSLMAGREETVAVVLQQPDENMMMSASNKSG